MYRYMKLKEQNLLKHNFESLQYMCLCVFLFAIFNIIILSQNTVITAETGISLVKVQATCDDHKTFRKT